MAPPLLDLVFSSRLLQQTFALTYKNGKGSCYVLQTPVQLHACSDGRRSLYFDYCTASVCLSCSTGGMAQQESYNSPAHGPVRLSAVGTHNSASLGRQ